MLEIEGFLDLKFSFNQIRNICFLMRFQYTCPTMIAADVVEVYLTLFQCLFELDFVSQLCRGFRAVGARKEERYLFFIVHVTSPYSSINFYASGNIVPIA